MSEGKRKGKASKPGFGATSKRIMGHLMGDDAAGPGPGAYLPSSTFGKYAKHKNKASNLPSPPFRSKSPSRPAAHNEHVPGAGTYFPEYTAIEPARITGLNNPAPFLAAKGTRFGGAAKGHEAEADWMTGSGTDPVVGPGSYETHRYLTLQADMKAMKQQMSRQSPGFGLASAAHELPHEDQVELDRANPGPGKYETNRSQLNSKGGGHSSVFKKPTERKAMREVDHRAANRAPTPKPGKAGKGGKVLSPTKTSPSGTVHV